jgi:hypothetical protein
MENYLPKGTCADTLFKFNFHIVELNPEKLKYGRFKEAISQVNLKDQIYIGNLKESNFKTTKLEYNKWFRRNDLLYLSLFDLVSDKFNIENNELEDTYLINGKKFKLYIDPCEFHSGRKPGWKSFGFYKDNKNIKLNRNLNNEDIISDLYSWVGENNSGNNIETINIFIMILPDTPIDKTIIFEDLLSYQKMDYLNNCMIKYSQLFDNISNFEMEYL